VTLRLYYPQLEQYTHGSTEIAQSPSSVIPTTTVAVARQEDYFKFVLPTSLQGLTDFCLVTKAMGGLADNGLIQTLGTISNTASSGNRCTHAWVNGGNNFRSRITVAGVNNLNSSITYARNQIGCIASRSNASNHATSMNGATTTLTGTGTAPGSTSAMTIGTDTDGSIGSSSQPGDLYVQQIALIANDVPNDMLSNLSRVP